MAKDLRELQALAKEVKVSSATTELPDWLAIYRLPTVKPVGTDTTSAAASTPVEPKAIAKNAERTEQTVGTTGEIAELSWLKSPLGQANSSYMMAQRMFYTGGNPDYRVASVGEFPVVPMTPAATVPAVESAVAQPAEKATASQTQPKVEAAAEVKTPAMPTTTEKVQPSKPEPTKREPVKAKKAELTATEIAERWKEFKLQMAKGERKSNVQNPEYYDGVRPQAMAAPDTESFRKLQKVVEPMIGHKMREYEPWFNTVRKMEDGCAAFVSEVLQRRYRIRGDWKVNELEDAVVNSGKFVKVKFEDAQPGDVIIAQRRPWPDGIERYPHAAIMWTDGNIVNNNSLHPGCPQIDVQPTDKFFIADYWDRKPMFESVVAYHYVGDKQYEERQAKKRQRASS